MTGTVKTRFAPSPTGRLHVGNVRTALMNYLFAKKAGGAFLLRLDDTDAERSTEEYAEAIQEDLSWLGLQWDALYRQSQRKAIYEAAAERLRLSGRLYACYETAEELELKRKLQLARRKPPVYDRASLDLSESEKRKHEAEGRRPHWRFLLDQRHVDWRDGIRGPVSIDCASLSDPVLIREDGTPLYTLPSVVDDGEMEISHVIRGEDHVANTAVQIQIARALGYEPPSYVHHALLTGASGEALSKRLGSLSILELRQRGFEPMAVASFLAKLGTSAAVEPRHSLAALIAELDLAAFSRAAAKFDPAELAQLNAKFLHATPYDEIAPRLAELGVAGAGEAFWEAVKPNLAVLKDACDWRRVVRGPLEPVIEDADYLAEALAALPEAPWSEDSWGEWTAALKAKTARKGKSLFQPLRLALTGRDHGPEMKNLLPLIGPERARRRLKGEAA